MFNLIKLELKRFNLKKKIKVAAICDLGILALFCMIVLIEKGEVRTTFGDYNEVFSLIATSINVTFLVYASALISELIISEYKNKTITLLFTYPIDRKKLLISKLIIIGVFIFMCIIISSIILYTSFYIIVDISKIFIIKVTTNMIMRQLIGIMVSALANSFIAMIPLYFGMRKKSTVATIVSGFLISSFLYSNNSGFSISSIVIVPVLMMLIGVFVVYITLKNIENNDVIV